MRYGESECMVQARDRGSKRRLSRLVSSRSMVGGGNQSRAACIPTGNLVQEMREMVVMDFYLWIGLIWDLIISTIHAHAALGLQSPNRESNTNPPQYKNPRINYAPPARRNRSNRSAISKTSTSVLDPPKNVTPNGNSPPPPPPPSPLTA